MTLKSAIFATMRPHDLDLGLGITASLIDLYLHNKFRSRQKTFCRWTDIDTG